jgi:hypothetical protein
MGCFTTILLLSGFVLIMVSFIRWFEQTAEAVDNKWWNKIAVLLVFPFAVWFFPSRVSAGRATPVPLHQPVRGFGGGSKGAGAVAPVSSGEDPPTEVGSAKGNDQPPPGTPKEFLGMPKIPPARARTKSSVDPEKLAKLKQKMREQGMLPPDEV